MSPSDRKFAANLKAATQVLAEVDERLRWLNAFAPAAIRDPATPASTIEDIDRVLRTCRETMASLDEIVGQVRQMYANEFANHRRTSYQFN